MMFCNIYFKACELVNVLLEWWGTIHLSSVLEQFFKSFYIFMIKV